MNSFDKNKVILACQNTLASIEESRKKSKGEHASFLYGQQETTVQQIYQVALHCESTTVNLSSEEFSSIHSKYKDLED